MRTNQNQQCQSSQKEIYIWKVITKLRKALSCFLCITVILTILSTVRVYAMTELETSEQLSTELYKLMNDKTFVFIGENIGLLMPGIMRHGDKFKITA